MPTDETTPMPVTTTLLYSTVLATEAISLPSSIFA